MWRDVQSNLFAVSGSSAFKKKNS
jgi:signal transduction histidine kinase